jgi:hypothetical protein
MTPCAVCPQVDKVHEGKEATVFLMAVVNVPGRTPVVVTTPKFCTELPENPSACTVCSAVADLVSKGVLHGSIDLAAEIRSVFAPAPETRS